ncbi:hypothetical protein K1719_026274 [Acacia pycnantha]|nr:hypothetical protein K1719_026274 [Acacia pycnantha]
MISSFWGQRLKAQCTVLRTLIGKGWLQNSTRKSLESRREEGRRIGSPSPPPSSPHLHRPSVSRKAQETLKKQRRSDCRWKSKDQPENFKAVGNLDQGTSTSKENEKLVES